MSHREQLKKVFDEIGLGYVISGESIILDRRCEKVTGSAWAAFDFDEDGSFKRLDIED